MLGFWANFLIGFMGIVGIALFIALVICIVHEPTVDDYWN